MLHPGSETHRKFQFPGPDTVLLMAWREMALACDYLLFRYSGTYRRRQAMKRLREFF
jgi:hypothetical protein